ncbi:MAG TPA: hypothetical protein VJS44_01595 [Pyrinomonadaceae bacterium]|nr:hypothetical protein [Pyrinomonadaceae bacterium]
MNKRITGSFLALLLLSLAAATAPSASAQTRASGATAVSAPAAQDPLQMLPASDGVVTADVRRVLNEALPRAFSSDPAKMAKINADIDRFKTRTGVDLRSIERMAIGARFREVGEATRMETVAIARGTFRADIIVAAGRLAAKDKYRTEKHAGKNIYVFTLDEQMKLFGLFNMKLTDVAVCVLDSNTLAIGQLQRVRETIDASGGRARVGADLVQLATRTPNALVGFGANVPAATIQNLGGFGLDSDEISKSIASIRQLYGAIGMTGTGFDMQAVARTENAAAAKSLNDTITGAKEFISPLVGQFMKDAAKAKLISNTLDSLKVSTAGNELQLKLEVAQSDLATLVGGTE